MCVCVSVYVYIYMCVCVYLCVHSVCPFTQLITINCVTAVRTFCCRYAVVRSPGVFVIFRDEAASLRPPVIEEVEDEEMGMGKSKDKHKNRGKDKDNENPNGELFSIKLPQVVTVEVNQKTGKDSSVHLLVELSDETLDLRVPAGQGDRTALEEAERWKTLLLAWKDYSIDHGESLLHLDFPHSLTMF